MEAIRTTEGKKETIKVSGRLDTITAPELEKVLNEALKNADSLCIDLEKLEYISSAGLRLLLVSHKAMKNKGGLVIRHVNDTVMEIFNVTGFADIFTIEK